MFAQDIIHRFFLVWPQFPMKTEIDFRQPAPQVFNAWPPAHVGFAECHRLGRKAPGKDNTGFIQLVKKELLLKVFAHPYFLAAWYLGLSMVSFCCSAARRDFDMPERWH